MALQSSKGPEKKRRGEERWGDTFLSYSLLHFCFVTVTWKWAKLRLGPRLSAGPIREGGPMFREHSCWHEGPHQFQGAAQLSTEDSHVPPILRRGRWKDGQGLGRESERDTNLPFRQIPLFWKSPWGICKRRHYDFLPQEYSWREKIEEQKMHFRHSF